MATDSSRPSPAHHRIKRILKSYHETAERSLNGPTEPLPRPSSAHRAAAALLGRPPRGCPSTAAPMRQQLPPPRGPVKRPGSVENPKSLQHPGKCDIIETNLEGHRIAGFEVGGEQRLCMPQILSNVLRDFDQEQVFAVCEELHIFFSRCDVDQLESLKNANILPQQVQNCGLITLTNAERICSTLLRHQVAFKCRLPVALEGLKVYHECFGGCKGIFVPEAFEFPGARCVQCAECGEMFAPLQFVSHSHSELENGTIHWGFNPFNWKSYLMLSFDQIEHARAQELLDSLKNKFEDHDVNKVVIKQEVDEDNEMPVKRIRNEAATSIPVASATSKCSWRPQPVKHQPQQQPKWVPADVDGASKFCEALRQSLDALKISAETKLPPFLNTQTPFLSDSDQVVSYSESQWNDRNYAPNVSLDPTPYKNLHDMYDDIVDDDEKHDLKEEKDVDIMSSPVSNRWQSSLTQLGKSMIAQSADSGNVSDDDSDDTESVLSDKLPPRSAEDDDVEVCNRISTVWNSRLGLLIEALEGELPRGTGAEGPMQDFLALQKQHADIINTLSDANGALSQRRLYLWRMMEEKLREMEEMRRSQDEELAGLKQETAMKMREAMLERCQLMEQIEKLSNGSVDSDLALMAKRYKEEAEMLRKQLQNAEEMNSSLRREISDLHRAIDNFTHSAVDPRGGLFLPLVIKPDMLGSNPGRASTTWRPHVTTAPANQPPSSLAMCCAPQGV